MYDLGGDDGGQVRKKRQAAPVAMASGGDDEDENEEDTMYDLGGDEGGQVAKPRRDDDEEEPMFSFVAMNEGDDDAPPVQPRSSIKQQPKYETPVPAYEVPVGAFKHAAVGVCVSSATCYNDISTHRC